MTHVVQRNLWPRRLGLHKKHLNLWPYSGSLSVVSWDKSQSIESEVSSSLLAFLCFSTSSSVTSRPPSTNSANLPGFFNLDIILQASLWFSRQCLLSCSSASLVSPSVWCWSSNLDKNTGLDCLKYSLSFAVQVQILLLGRAYIRRMRMVAMMLALVL